MTQTSKTIVFFGSGPVAAASLALLQEAFTIEAVVTKPQPAHHKEVFPVLALSETLGLKVFTPNGKKELSALFASKPTTSTLGVVIDYGFIINKDVIDYFPLGIVNSHFSLLPEWRGADPISFAILSGQRQTGVSLMLINEQMDEGPLLAQAPYDIEPDATTPSLTDDLIQVSHEALCEILPAYLDGHIQPAPQEEVSMADSKIPTYSRKLTKDDGVLDFTKPAAVLEREIRAFIEWPKSRTTIGGIDVIITSAHAVTGGSGTDNVIVNQVAHTIELRCSEGSLRIERLKPAGKKEMTAEAFLAGHRHLL